MANMSIFRPLCRQLWEIWRPGVLAGSQYVLVALSTFVRKKKETALIGL